MSRKTPTKPRIARFPEKNLGQPSPQEGLSTFPANELQATDFPPLKFLVEGLITEGLTLLAGKPKMGKSWMALDIAMLVAIGCEVLGNRPCEKGVALYCALEDNPRRLRRRMLHNYGDQINWPLDFHFATQMNKLDEGGLDDLEDWITEHRPCLIILDTLARIKPASKGKNEYEADDAALLPLQELAGKHGISIIVIHHLRKMTGDDPLDMVSGTTGLTGAVDNVLVLDRKSDGVTLYGRGREMENIDLALELDDGLWRILGDTDTVRISDERRAVLEVLRNAEGALGPKDMAEALDWPQENVRQLLKSMATDGEVKKLRRGKYALP
ncbi:helicase RepA family protein [Ruegeria sp. WL0004]|uniref:Helicase RepA family protein n=1 Tax=Ruegeria marisflavi TaxID=2984152 RepID=A0ABT2WXG7_9RHOB|nr:helicase RepA family protein [Ruegeria sp. WL0004]MCU9840603.1 helicase RepA family protein [Ruegeria sp. WL0004]